MASHPPKRVSVSSTKTAADLYKTSRKALSPEDKDVIREAMKRIGLSRTFRRTPHYVECLNFVVKEFLTGRQHLIDARELAIEQFNGAKDSNARAEMGRIREKLFKYYHQEGPSDPVRIEFDDGDYLPRLYRWVPPPPAPDPPAHRAHSADVQSNTVHLWNIPRPNRFFTGREAFLTSLREALINNSSAAIAQPQAITGLGGMGKTQTAIEYAQRYKDRYTAGFWINAESRDSMLSGCVSLANLLELPQRRDGDLDLVAEAVHWWLGSHTGWLLVLDNVDDLNVVSPFIPSGLGHCIITTRLHTVGTIGDSVELGQLNLSDGALFLLRRAKVIAKNAQLKSASESDRALAERITEELGGLPLALDQAGAFIDESPSTLFDYLNLYQSEGATLRAHRGDFSAEHPPVTKTFQLAFASVESRSAAGADMVRACAFLGSDMIPEEIFAEGGDHLGPAIKQVATNPLAFAEALRDAARFALIRRDAVNKTIHVHHLVQQVIQDDMNEATRRLWAHRVVSALDQIIPEPTQSAHPIYDRLFLHIATTARQIKRYQLQDATVGTFLSKCGRYFGSHSALQAATVFTTLAIEIRGRVLGSEHSDTLSSLIYLAWLSSLTNLLEGGSEYDAEALYRQVLAIRQRTLGPEHPDTVSVLIGLASVTNKTETEALYRQVLGIRERTLGIDHPDTVSVLMILARHLSVPNKTETEALYRQVLAIRQRTLGPEHPDTVSVLIDLARHLGDIDRTSDAEALYRQVLGIRERTLGIDHPDTVSVLMILARHLSVTNKTETEALYRQVLAIRQRTLGPEHPDTVSVLIDLARHLIFNDQTADADTLYIQILAIRERTLGIEHPDTIRSLNDVAAITFRLNRFVDAERLYTRALEILEELDLAHALPLKRRALSGLADVKKRLHKYNEAESLLRTAIAAYEESKTGELFERALYRSVLSKYSELLRHLGRDAEAIAIEEQIKATHDYQNNIGPSF